MLITGADTEDRPALRFQPGDKLGRVARQGCLVGQGDNIVLGDIMQHQEGYDERQGVPGLIVLLLFQRQQVIVAADDLENLVTIRDKFH